MQEKSVQSRKIEAEKSLFYAGFQHLYFEGQGVYTFAPIFEIKSVTNAWKGGFYGRH